MSTLADRLTLPGSPFELGTAAINGQSLSVFRHSPTSLSGVYRKSTGSAHSICIHVGGRDFSYGDVWNDASALAHWLVEKHGIRSETRVALVASRSPRWLAAFMAITSIGAVAVLVDRDAPPSQLIASLEQAGCPLVVTEIEVAQRLASLGERRPCVPIDGEAPEWARPTAGAALLATPIDPDQEALIAFTSGSTGTPKGAICTHRAVLTGLMNMSLAGALASLRAAPGVARNNVARAAPCSILTSPFSHVSGYSHLLLMMQVAGTSMPLSEWDTATVLQLARQKNVSSLNGVHAESLMELLHADRSVHDLASLASIGLHGSALRPNLIAQMRERLPWVRPTTGYGLTETNGSVALAMGDDLHRRPRSCGTVVPTVSIRLLNDDGEEVATGVSGEIWLRGAMLMSGYCSAPHLTARAMHGGWLRTGDFGHMDSDGFLYIDERREQVFDLDGRRISCAQLEQMLCESGSVQDAAVLLIDSSRQDLRLLIAAVPARSPLEAESSVRAQLDLDTGIMSRPRVEILMLERLPRTSTGKIDRRALRAHADA